MKREHLIIKWILRVTHADKNSSIDFADWISDGNILSRYVAYLNFPAKIRIDMIFFVRIMSTLCFNSVERDQWGTFGCSPEEQRYVLTEIGPVVLKIRAGQKFFFPSWVSTHYGMKQFSNKICLLCKMTEIQLFVYILIKFPNQQICIKKCQKIIFRHKIIMKSWFLVVSGQKMPI